MMVFQRNTSYCTTIRKPFPGYLHRVYTIFYIKVNAIIICRFIKHVQIEICIMGNYYLIFKVLLYRWPQFFESGCILHHFWSNAMHMSIRHRPIIWDWLDERIEFLHYHFVLNPHYPYSACAGMLSCHRFKVDGCKIKIFH